MTCWRAIGLGIVFTGVLVAGVAVAQNLDQFKGCGLTGSAASACGKALNQLKNRYRAPTAQEIDSAITLSALLAPGDDATRWNTAKGAVVTGYVAGVEPGRTESCNCDQPGLLDVHIYVVADPKDIGHIERYVVVEITPRMQSLHPSWTQSWAKTLKEQGRRVKFTGWMLFDGMHSREAQNTKAEKRQKCGNLKVKEIWRATAWEIHPVTGIEVLAGP